MEWVYVLFLCISVNVIASESSLQIDVVRDTGCGKKESITQLEVTKKALNEFVSCQNSVEAHTENNGPLKIYIGELQEVTSDTIKALFAIAEDLEASVDKISEVCTKNTALIELANRFDACKTVQDKIAKIRFADCVYDTLYNVALGKDDTSSVARAWFLRCIGNASDEKKIELRKKLYPLQYRSKEFITLRRKVISVYQDTKTYKKTSESPKFNELQEFKIWQNSFLHQAYCAAKISNTLSCTEFNEITQEAGGLCNTIISICSSCCNLPQKDEWNPCGTWPCWWATCTYCVEKMAEKRFDLSDCYVLDKYLLASLIGAQRPESRFYMVLEEKFFKHLPQIHLPLLELLIHYKRIDYDNGSKSRINFGTTPVDLDPVDIKALSLFRVSRSEAGSTAKLDLIYTFIIKSKNNVKVLKRELSRLRTSNNVFIKFIAPYAAQVDRYDYRLGIDTNDYSSIWVDNWWLRGALTIAGLYCIYKLVTTKSADFAHMFLKDYNNDLSAYKTQLEQCASKIPEQTQAVAGYLSNTKDFVDISLPSEFRAPSFTGNPNGITLPEIKSARQAACVLNQITRPQLPVTYWGCTGLAAAGLTLLNVVIFNWTGYFFPFNWPIINACRIAIVKPYRASNQNDDNAG